MRAPPPRSCTLEGPQRRSVTVADLDASGELRARLAELTAAAGLACRR